MNTSEKRHRRTTLHQWLKAAVFTTILCALLLLANELLMPAWLEWSNFSTMRGFYEQPKDTLQAVFVGTSSTISGFSPITMYDEQGICAYNIGTEQQPAMMSYYWTREAHRTHQESLKAVVLEVTGLRYDPEEPFYQKALVPMRLSGVKQEAAADFQQASESQQANGREQAGNLALNNLVPLFAFHGRWAELQETDFTKAGLDTHSYTRGHPIVVQRTLPMVAGDQANYPVPVQLALAQDEKAELDPKAVRYVRELVEYCREAGLKLFLVKTPTSFIWNEGYHNAVQELADQCHIPFIDFNLDPLLTQIGFDALTDTMDGSHLNVFGAQKVSSWIARYLREECGCEDVRGDSRYEFLRGDSERWHARYDGFLKAKAQDADVADYLQDVCGSGHTVFIVVKDEASRALTDDQRSAFGSLGLPLLAHLEFRDSYIGVVEDGEVVLEDTEKAPEDDMGVDPLTHEHMIAGGKTAQIQSGGWNHGLVASLVIGGSECAQNARGLNIVVLDSSDGTVLDSVCFDTYEESVRRNPDPRRALDDALQSGAGYEELPGDLRALYQYDLRCAWQARIKASKFGGQDTPVASRLKLYLDNPGLEVAIVGAGNVSSSLGEADRNALREMGFPALADLGKNEPFCALIRRDGTKEEGQQRSGAYASLDTELVRMTSHGKQEANASILLAADGYTNNYVASTGGLCVLAYDPTSLAVIDVSWL